VEYPDFIDKLVDHMRRTGQNETETVAQLLPTLLPQLSPRARRTMAEFANLKESEFYRRLALERAHLAWERLVTSAGSC
jgi:hypothetical protein